MLPDQFFPQYVNLNEIAQHFTTLGRAENFTVLGRARN